MPNYNILYLHNKSDISGGERSLLSLWENLDRSTFTPILIVPCEGGFSREASLLKIKVMFYPFPQLRPWNIIAILGTLRFLRTILKVEHVHLIHSYSARNNVLSSLIGRLMRIPVIWHERNVLMKDEADITKKLSFLPDAVICNSKAVAHRLGKLPPKVQVIPNGVDIKKFVPTIADAGLKKKYNCDQKRIVGIVTNLTLRRRVEYFIEAASLIKSQKPDVAFFIVGGEFEEPSKGRKRQLEIKSNKLGLPESLFFVGWQEDVRPWISLFDVSCHVTSQDACSRSVLEAMSMARAIVAMNDGGNLELIENGKSGILVSPDDPHLFVKSVVELLNNEDQRKHLGLAARQRVEKLFDIKQNTRLTQNLYTDLVNRSGAI